MKKLIPLILLVMMSLNKFFTERYRQYKIQLKKPIARLVIKDLITGDGAKKELNYY